MIRIGILGGTFDPPHIGHLIVATEVRAALALDRVLFVPAAAPPHKQGQDVAAQDVRLGMLRAALEDEPAFEVSELELERGGASYSVDTLRTLRGAEPDAELFFIIGADQYAEFATWREPEEIASLARLVVIPRGCTGPEDVTPGIDVPHEVVQTTRIAVASSEIRRRVREGEAWKHLVPAAVAEIIEGRGLYGAAAASGR